MKVAECVTTCEVLPSTSVVNGWDEIVTAPEVKDRLLHAALLALELRSRLPFTSPRSDGHWTAATFTVLGRACASRAGWVAGVAATNSHDTAAKTSARLMTTSPYSRGLR